MDIFEELSRKLTMIEARIASYERLHTEELAELKTMLQSLKMQQVSLRSEAARDAAKRAKSEMASEKRSPGTGIGGGGGGDTEDKAQH